MVLEMSGRVEDTHIFLFSKAKIAIIVMRKIVRKYIFKFDSAGKERVVIINAIEPAREALLKGNDFAGRPTNSFPIQLYSKNYKGIGSADFTKQHIAMRKLAYKSLHIYGNGMKNIEKAAVKELDGLVESLRKENEMPIPMHDRLSKYKSHTQRVEVFIRYAIFEGKVRDTAYWVNKILLPYILPPANYGQLFLLGSNIFWKDPMDLVFNFRCMNFLKKQPFFQPYREIDNLTNSTLPNSRGSYLTMFQSFDYVSI